MRKPDFFIVGAPKCGTTAMNDYLKQHPEIFIPEAKELHFFGTDLEFNRPRRTQEEYLSYFAGVKSEKRVGEASVWYLYSRNAANEMKRFSPSADIIIMLRNPVDVLYSQHSQFLYNGNEDIIDFESALNAGDDRKKGLRIPHTASFVEGLFYRETAKYTPQIQRYLDVFDWENVHIIIFDDFKSDTAKTYRETLRFLEVSLDFQPDFEVVNPNKRVRSIVLRYFYQPPAQTKRWLWLVKAFLMPRSVRRALRQGLKQYNTIYVPRPPLDPELRKRLQTEFAPEVERLSQLLGRDLTHWSKT
jgi:hypothetical protein